VKREGRTRKKIKEKSPIFGTMKLKKLSNFQKFHHCKNKETKSFTRQRWRG
jgi:hypothetical protein